MDISLEDTRLVQVRICAEISIRCVNYDPKNRPDIKGIIRRLAEIEGTDEFLNSGFSTSIMVQVCSKHQLIKYVVHKDLVFRCS